MMRVCWAFVDLDDKIGFYLPAERLSLEQAKLLVKDIETAIRMAESGEAANMRALYRAAPGLVTINDQEKYARKYALTLAGGKRPERT